MIVMKETATSEEIDAVVAKIERAGALAHRSQGARVTVIGAIGDVEQDVSVDSLGLEGQPGSTVSCRYSSHTSSPPRRSPTASAPCSKSRAARSAGITSR